MGVLVLVNFPPDLSSDPFYRQTSSDFRASILAFEQISIESPFTNKRKSEE